MIEAGFIMLVTATGFVLMSAPRRRPPFPFRIAAALPVGTAAFIVTASLLLVIPIRLSPGWAALVLTHLVVALAVAGRGSLYEDGGRWAGPMVAATIVGAFLLSGAFQWADLTRITPDSLSYVQIASILEQTGTLTAVQPPRLLLERQLLVPLLHVIGPSSGDAFLASITPMIGLSGLAVLGWAIHWMLRNVGVRTRTRGGLIAAALLFLGSINRFRFHLFYINGHLVFAVLLLVVIVGFLMTEREGSRDWDLVIGTAVAALLVSRPDAPLVLGLVMVPALARTELPARSRWWWTCAFVGTVALWIGYAVRPRLVGSEAFLRSGADGVLAVAAAVLLLRIATAIPQLRPFTAFAPPLMIVGIVAATGYMALENPELMRRSLAASQENLLGGAGHWNVTWWVLLILAPVAVVVRTLPFRELWASVVIGFPPLLLALSYLREIPYRVGPGDSANRLMTHILLAVVLLVTVAAGAHSRQEPDPDVTA